MDKLKKMRARMLLKHPFFATLLMSTPAKATDVLPNGQPLPTAATDMETLYYNQSFIDSLDDDTVLFVLAHEVMHIALTHGARLLGRNPVIWNIACDFAINLTLEETGFKLWDQCLIDKKYAGMTADEIYQQLHKEAAAMAKKMGLDKMSKEQLEEMFGDAGGMIGDIQEQPGAGDPAKEAKTRRSIQQRVAQAANMARMAGKMPGALDRLISEILDPKVPWAHYLRDYMTRINKDDESWSRRNRRFQGVYLPRRYSEKMGEIVLIGDTSGSIGNEELCQYMAEAGAIAEDVHPERIRILWADTKVAGMQVFEEGEPLVAKPQGGGGTDMRVPLSKAEEFQPEVVVLFTDGYTPWPDGEPPFPLIVCCTTDVEPPVGQLVRI